MHLYPPFNNSSSEHQFAELFGAFLGDGCISKYSPKDRKNPRYCSLLTGHTHDRDYYENSIQPIIKKLYGFSARIRPRAKVNCIVLVTMRKELFQSMQEAGLPVGKKTRLFIPKWIFDKNEAAIDCVRGIFDTDGTVYNRYSKKYANHSKHYKYKVVQIKMKQPKLIKQVKDVLNRLKITTTKISTSNGAHLFRITDQTSIALFFETIKPNNKYHVERYKQKN
ncbi:hypothetical protein HYY74_06035 [Candidatus Woesearchaeota archaeon]|nr:hypothetical protein [Candidatus Woesearchaeota archaeon]